VQTTAPDEKRDQCIVFKVLVVLSLKGPVTPDAFAGVVVGSSTSAMQQFCDILFSLVLTDVHLQL
jgi:hypothetical protein